MITSSQSEEQYPANENRTRPGSGVGAAARAVVELLELHAKLARDDGKRWVQSSAMPLGLAIAGAIIAAGSFSVLLLGAADGLAALTGLEQAIATVICGAAGLLLAALMIALSGRNLRRGSASFAASRQEWRRTLRWIKQQFGHDT
jgi:hypothetical protein